MEAKQNHHADEARSESGFTTASERQRREARRAAQGSYSQSSTLRDRLIEPHFLGPDEVRDVVMKMGLGCTLENISKLSRSTMDSIKQVEFVDPKKADRNATKLQVGRSIYEFCVNMIIPCGEAFVMAVKYNFDLNNELETIVQDKGEVSNKILQKRQSSAVVHRPDKEVFNGRTELAVGKQDILLQRKHKGLFEARMKLLQEVNQFQQTQSSAQSPPLVGRLRSTSRGTAEPKQTDQESSGQASGSGDAQPAATLLEIWEQSDDYRRYQAELEAYEKQVRLQNLEAFIAQQDSWEKYESTKGGLEADLMRLEEMKANLQTLELVFQEARNQMNTIVQKVKNAVSSHTFVRDKLASQIVVNNESISQPIYSDNLCGIFHILHREYSTATFELFCTFLMELLSITATPEELATNPYIVAQRTDAKLKMWLDFKFDDFMTRDNLFTIANLKTLQGDVRKDAMTRVLEKAHQLEHQEGEASDTVLEYTGMPLYSEIVRYEKTLSETSTFPSGQKLKSATSSKQDKIPEQDALENAAAADENPVKTAKKMATGPYNSEVTRAHGLWGPNGFPYTGTKSYCPDCKARNNVHDKPSCLLSQCTACGYFGHRSSECQHTPKPNFKKGGDAKRS